MQQYFRKLSLLLFVLTLSVIHHTVNAQVTKSINQLIPMESVDKRGGIHKIVGGLGFSVHVTIFAGIKNTGACSEADFGKLDAELIWYDLNDETGKFLVQTLEQLGGIEQEKEGFFNQETGYDGNMKTESLGSGMLKYGGTTKACVNELTGSTGDLEYMTYARYFEFTGTTIIKIKLHAGLKPETVKSMLSKMAEEIKKFDFAIYKTAEADEKE